MTVEKSQRNVKTLGFSVVEICSDHFVVVKLISRHLKRASECLSRSRVEKPAGYEDKVVFSKADYRGFWKVEAFPFDSFEAHWNRNSLTGC